MALTQANLDRQTTEIVDQLSNKLDMIAFRLDVGVYVGVLIGLAAYIEFTARTQLVPVEIASVVLWVCCGVGLSATRVYRRFHQNILWHEKIGVILGGVMVACFTSFWVAAVVLHENRVAIVLGGALFMVGDFFFSRSPIPQPIPMAIPSWNGPALSVEFRLWICVSVFYFWWLAMKSCAACFSFVLRLFMSFVHWNSRCVLPTSMCTILLMLLMFLAACVCGMILSFVLSIVLSMVAFIVLDVCGIIPAVRSIAIPAFIAYREGRAAELREAPLDETLNDMTAN